MPRFIRVDGYDINVAHVIFTSYSASDRKYCVTFRTFDSAYGAKRATKCDKCTQAEYDALISSLSEKMDIKKLHALKKISDELATISKKLDECLLAMAYAPGGAIAAEAESEFIRKADGAMESKTDAKT